jgi:hypothetical protein
VFSDQCSVFSVQMGGPPPYVVGYKVEKVLESFRKL